MTKPNENSDKKVAPELSKKEPLLLLPAPAPKEPQPPFINGDKWAAEADRDPKTGRFVPGYQGGPGRPKGVLPMKSLIDEGLMEMGAKDAHGNPVPIEKALVQKIIKMALAGDRKMIEMIWNYRDGKPPQHIDVTSKGQHIGKRRLSEEEIKRVDDLFGPKEWPEDDEVELPTQPNTNNGPANTQPETNTETGESDSRKDAPAPNGEPRGAYESNT